MEKETILKIISKLENDKKQSRKFPTFVRFYELLKYTGSEASDLKNKLNELVKDKKIGFGRCLNENYFYICENENKI